MKSISLKPGRLIENTFEWLKVSLLGRDAGRDKTKAKRESTLVYLIPMNVDVSNKNKCPLEGEKKFMAQAWVNASRL